MSQLIWQYRLRGGLEPYRMSAELGFGECSFCGVPRRLSVAICPICGGPNVVRQFADAPEDLALRLVAEGRWDPAAAFVEGEIAAGRETSKLALIMAWIAMMNKDLRAVETWCHEALRLDGTSAGPHVVLGLVLEQASRWEEAVDEYTLALEREPEAARREEVLNHRKWCQSQIPEW